MGWSVKFLSGTMSKSSHTPNYVESSTKSIPLLGLEPGHEGKQSR